MPRNSVIAVLCGTALAVAGCGSSSHSSNIPSGNEPAAAPPATQTTTTAQAPAPKAGPKPKIAKPSGPPPKKLKIIDLKKGTGATAKSGDQVTVQYVGVLYKTGQQFDASYDTGQPFPFPLGGGQVIPGWDKGVAGMKVGGRRQLVIPPALGYGAQGSPPKIPPNATLIFDIDLVKVG